MQNQNRSVITTQTTSSSSNETTIITHPIPKTKTKQANYVRKQSIVKPANESKYNHGKTLQSTVDIFYEETCNGIKGSVTMKGLRIYSQDAILNNFTSFINNIGQEILHDASQQDLQSDFSEFNVLIHITTGDDKGQDKIHTCFAKDTCIQTMK